MGFLSTLGKIAGVVTPFIPGVGPAASLGMKLASKVPSALSALGAVSQVGGKQSAGAAEGRIKEADLLQRADQLRNQQYGTQQGAESNAGQLDLQRKGFTEGARGSRAKQALLADMISGYQPTRVSVAGVKNADISGGPQIGEGGRKAMAELSRQALLAQLTPDEFTGGKVLAPPSMSKLPQAGKLDTTRSVLSQIGQLGGAVAPFLSSGQQAPAPLSLMGAGTKVPPEMQLGSVSAPAAGTPSAMTAAELKRLQQQLEPSF